MRPTRLLIPFVAAVSLCCGIANGTPRATLPAASVPHRADVVDLGRAPAATRVSLALTLAYRNDAELRTLVTLQADRRSPLYRRFLSSEQFDAYFAPTSADYVRAQRALVRAGFRITGTFANRTVIDADGSANIAERYFTTEIHAVVERGAGRRYANAKPAVLPPDLRGIVASVSGLSDLTVARPSLAFPDPAVRSRAHPRVAEPAVRTSRPVALRIRSDAAPGRRLDASNVVLDPGFESGGYASWRQCGDVNATVQSAVRHSGTYAERSGSSAGEPNGDAGLCQGITVPPSGTLRFYADDVSNEANTDYAYAWAALADANGVVLKTLYQTVANTHGFVPLSFDISSYAGKKVYLFFGVHGDGYAGASTQQYVDDVNVTGPSPTPKPSATPTATPSPKPTATPTPTAAPIAGPTTGPDQGYGPSVIADAYDLPVQHGFDGKGRATGVAISGDFSDADLRTYLAYFGIVRTGPPTKRVEVDGGASYDPTYSLTNASVEATLDVETIVGIAPGTALTMYLIPDLSSAHIEDGYNRAVSDGLVDVVNSSFGGCETDDDSFNTSTNSIAMQGAAKGITFAASSGDSGSSECGAAASVSSPASDPAFVAVGGTTLDVTASGAYSTESAWNGSGGGVSTVAAEPSYQRGVPGASSAGRNVPDVALAADPNLGTSFYFGTGGSFVGWDGPVGGTSWSCPIFSALLTEIDERQHSRAGFADPQLYQAFAAHGYAVYHDVATGDNGSFSAKHGFDNVTGIGSPKGYGLSGVL